jgi:hypothetical protein
LPLRGLVGLLRRAETGGRVGVRLAKDRGADEADIACPQVGQADGGDAFFVRGLLGRRTGDVASADGVIGEVEVGVGEYATDH